MRRFHRRRSFRSAKKRWVWIGTNTGGGSGNTLAVNPLHTFIGIVTPLNRGAQPGGDPEPLPEITVHRIIADLTIDRFAGELSTPTAGVWLAFIRAQYDVNDNLVTSALRDISSPDNNTTQWSKFLHYRYLLTGNNGGSPGGSTTILNNYHFEITRKVVLHDDEGIVFGITADNAASNDASKSFKLMARALCSYGRR